MSNNTLPSDVTTTGADNRTAPEVLRQYERLYTIRNRLIQEGAVSGNCTMAQVIGELRRIIPADLF